MSRVDELLRAYIALFRESGEADPLPLLEQTHGVERVELAALIDGFLAQAPAPAFESAAFEQFAADSRREALVRRVVVDEEETLQSLRRAANATKAQVGIELARELGVEGHESEVKARYHDLETGVIDPQKVTRRAWEGLSRIFESSAERVRDATAAAFSGAGGAEATAVFARSTVEPGMTHVMASRAAQEPSVVDRAFFGPAD